MHLLVSIMRDGTVYFGTDKINVDSLTGKVKDRLANRTDKRVYVKADAAPTSGNVGPGSGRCTRRGCG